MSKRNMPLKKYYNHPDEQWIMEKVKGSDSGAAYEHGDKDSRAKISWIGKKNRIQIGYYNAVLFFRWLRRRTKKYFRWLKNNIQKMYKMK